MIKLKKYLPLYANQKRQLESPLTPLPVTVCSYTPYPLFWRNSPSIIMKRRQYGIITIIYIRETYEGPDKKSFSKKRFGDLFKTSTWRNSRLVAELCFTWPYGAPGGRQRRRGDRDDGTAPEIIHDNGLSHDRIQRPISLQKTQEEGVRSGESNFHLILII